MTDRPTMRAVMPYQMDRIADDIKNYLDLVEAGEIDEKNRGDYEQMIFERVMETFLGGPQIWDYIDEQIEDNE